MNEHLFIGAYWSAREESRYECATRISEFLQSIADVPHFSQWFLRGRSRKTDMVPIDVSVENISEKLRGQKGDYDSAPIPDLGFNLNTWNGRDDAPVSFDVTCGCFSKSIDNFAVLKLPSHRMPLDTTLELLFRKILNKSIDAWNPDIAVLCSREFIERSGGGFPQDVGGWLTYKRGQKIISKL